MRVFLFVLAILSGGLTLVLLLAALAKGGSDIQIIGAGVFLTVLAVSLAGIGVMARLEQIRDRAKQ